MTLPMRLLGCGIAFAITMLAFEYGTGKAAYYGFDLPSGVGVPLMIGISVLWAGVGLWPYMRQKNRSLALKGIMLAIGTLLFFVAGFLLTVHT